MDLICYVVYGEWYINMRTLYSVSKGPDNGDSRSHNMIWYDSYVDGVFEAAGILLFDGAWKARMHSPLTFLLHRCKYRCLDVYGCNALMHVQASMHACICNDSTY